MRGIMIAAVSPVVLEWDVAMLCGVYSYRKLPKSTENKPKRTENKTEHYLIYLTQVCDIS